MRLLFDANISRRIVALLNDLFPGSTQVMILGLSGETPDREIWTIARNGGFVIVTADGDFLRLAERDDEAVPKVVWLERMNYSTEVAAALIRRNAIAIGEFEKSDKRVLTLRRY